VCRYRSSGLVFLLAALGAAARLSASALPAAAIEILSPAPESAARAGSSVTLEWRATAAAPRFEEWEAFLSLDGGATWPYRLTPHLDRALSRVEVELPPVPSPRARLLFRFGDERQERELLVPFSLAIGRSERDALPAALPALPAAAVGEPALPGGAGVREWIAGPRNGSRLVHVALQWPDTTAPRAESAAADATPIAAAPLTPEARPAQRAGDLASTRFTPPNRSDGFAFPAAADSARRLARLGRRNT